MAHLILWLQEVSHPKAVDSIGIHVEDFDELQLQREIGMMQSEQTPNEIIDRELEMIEQMQRERVVTVND